MSTTAPVSQRTYQPQVVPQHDANPTSEPAETGTTGGPDGPERGSDAGASGQARKGAKEGARRGSGSGAEAGAQAGVGTLGETAPAAPKERQTSVDAEGGDVAVTYAADLPADVPIPNIDDIDFRTETNFWSGKHILSSIEVTSPDGTKATAESRNRVAYDWDGHAEVTYKLQVDGYEYEYEAKFTNGEEAIHTGDWRPTDIELTSARKL